MNSKLFLSLIATLLIVACKENTPVFTLDGKYNSGHDTLYIFGLDHRHGRVDTVITDKRGQFTYTIETDTIIPLTVVLPDGTMMPLYAESWKSATLQRDSADATKWHIAGNGEAQQLYDSIAAQINSATGKSERMDIIDKFIEKHPYSEINIHLLQKYFIEIPDAKNALIRQRIDKLGGTLQDNDYLATSKQLVDSKNSNIQHKAFPIFNYKTAENTIVTRSNYLDKYLIVTFWASWDSASVTHLRNLRHLEKEIDTTFFAMMNISVDHDTVAWRKCIEKDSIAGDNICDGKMWDNEIIKEFTVEKLPFSILVNPFQRIDMFGVTTNGITQYIDSVVTKFKNSERYKKRKADERKKAIQKKILTKTETDKRKNNNPAEGSIIKESIKAHP